MARTRKDRPYRVAKPDLRSWEMGHPPLLGGAWCGLGEAATRWWRRERRRVKQALYHGDEQPLSRPRHTCRWSWY